MWFIRRRTRAFIGKAMTPYVCKCLSCLFDVCDYCLKVRHITLA